MVALTFAVSEAMTRPAARHPQPLRLELLAPRCFRGSDLRLCSVEALSSRCVRSSLPLDTHGAPFRFAPAGVCSVRRGQRTLCALYHTDLDAVARKLIIKREVIRNLELGRPAAALAIHTATGNPPELDEFISALAPHLPWDLEADDNQDWFVNLQVEGASAVHAAVDLLLQLQQERRKSVQSRLDSQADLVASIARGLDSGSHAEQEKQRAMLRSAEATLFEIKLSSLVQPTGTKVAVGAASYHGPGSTSYGSTKPLGPFPTQLEYPVPSPFARHAGEDDQEFHGRMLRGFSDFLDAHRGDIGVLLIEPQWGSSVAGLPWPKDLLRQYINLAQSAGILVCCDEIMCGLGRSGLGDLFISRSLDLQPDAVTFGKAIASGVHPLAGVAIRRGGNVLRAAGRSVLQMHTYAGSSARALLTGARPVPPYLIV